MWTEPVFCVAVAAQQGAANKPQGSRDRRDCWNSRQHDTNTQVVCSGRHHLTQNLDSGS